LEIAENKTVLGRSYYRATRMHCEDYAVARCLSVCLSVRLSHTGIVCKRLHISSMFFYHRVAPPFWFFLHQTGWQYSDGDPPNGGVECKGVWKNHDFRTISGFISKLMQDRAIVLHNGIFKKLLDKDAPISFIRILHKWYNNLQCSV